MDATYPRKKQLHPQSANKCHWLFPSVHEVIGVYDPHNHNEFEFLRPVLSRCAVPVQMLRFFQYANIASIRGYKFDQTAHHTVETVLGHLLCQAVYHCILSSIDASPKLATSHSQLRMYSHIQTWYQSRKRLWAGVKALAMAL
eukprot:scaffold44842_cov56-Cyclotella_meneghiniana.AAC.1